MWGWRPQPSERLISLQMVQMFLLPDCHPPPHPRLSLTHTQYLGVTPIHTASSVHPSVFPSFLSTGKDLALGDKFLLMNVPCGNVSY